MSERIDVGSRVRMRYRLVLPDGTVADQSGDQPLEFSMGDGTLVAGLELALYGLQAGESQTLTLTPQQTFGYPDPDNVHTLARTDFPADMALSDGSVVAFDTPGGAEVAGTVVEVGEEQVRVDFNHPLSGYELEFSVEIIEVAPADDPPRGAE